MPWIGREWISEEEMAFLVKDMIQDHQDQLDHEAAQKAHRKGPDFCDCYECSCASYIPGSEKDEEWKEHGSTSDHVAEYARNHGALSPERAWILSPFDTWERNPSYQGPPVPHPEG